MRSARREQIKDMKISLTSLLDLTFNILAFFVITFKPPMATKSYQVNLPPPKAGENAVADGTSDIFDIGEPEIFEDVTLTLSSTPTGVISGLRLEGKPIEVSPGQKILARDLAVLVGSFRGTGRNLEAINIVSPAELKYRYLIEVVDVCQQVGFKKINFAETPSAPQ
jgi:biopolymer transport protein ExbD